MAEKEKRIWLEFDIPKPKGAIEATCCTTMTRQDAINRMAKAMIDIAFAGSSSRFEDSCILEDAIPYAEAALNALFGKE